jgi:hypothetical protein
MRLVYPLGVTAPHRLVELLPRAQEWHLGEEVALDDGLQ